VLVRGFFYHADLFTFGIVVAVAHVAIQQGLWRPSQAWRWGAWSGLLVSAGLAVWLTDQGIINFYQGAVEYETLVSIACALLVALVVMPGARPEKMPALMRALETRPLVFVGLVSYSLFLWHEPLIRSLQSHGLTLGGTSGFFMSLGLFLVVSLAAAGLTYHYVEKPFLRRKRAVTAPSPTPQGTLPVPRRLEHV
jgi:peptidoglycan/LPS O-acetylase OafA/YrhL